PVTLADIDPGYTFRSYNGVNCAWVVRADAPGPWAHGGANMSRFPRTIAAVLGCFFSAPICLAAGPDNKPLLTLYGRNSKITERKVIRVTSEQELKALWMEHKTGTPDPKVHPGDLEYAELDFGKVMVIAVFEGEATNCAGYTAHSIREDRKRITV